MDDKREGPRAALTAGDARAIALVRRPRNTTATTTATDT